MLFLLMLASCGAASDKYSGIEIDTLEFAEKIEIAGSFDDELALISKNATTALYSFSGAVSVVAYAGSGATAEEILVITAADEEGAAALVKLLESRRVSRRIDFKDYNPQEQPKIDAATIIKAGKYAIYCVSASPEATYEAIIGLLDEQIDKQMK